MDNTNALIFIRGERPVMDKKFNILSHSNIKLTEDGGAKPYKHIRNNGYVINDVNLEVSDDIEDIEIIEFSEEEEHENE